MKDFFNKDFNNEKNDKDFNIPIDNSKKGKRIKKLSPVVSMKRSKIIFFVFVLIFLAGILGGVIAKFLDLRFFRTNILGPTDITIDNKNYDEGEAVSLKAAPSVVGIRCVIRDRNELRRSTIPSIFSIFGDFYDSDSDGENERKRGDGKRDYGADVSCLVDGSGVIYKIEKDFAYIITNFHTVRHVLKSGEQSEIEIHFGRDVEKFTAGNVVGCDPSIDIAVLKVPIGGKTLACAEIGDSEKVKQGETIYCLGSPGGIDFICSMTRGIVSAVNRKMGIEGSKEKLNLIQIDAAINHGSSGGGLFNREGKLIGISFLKIGKIGVNSGEAESMNFCLPINMVKNAVDKIMDSSGGNIIKKIATLGILLESEESLALFKLINGDRFYGVFVKGVLPGSVAEKAGIYPGDLIVEFDGEKIKDNDDLNIALSKKRDKSGRIVVLRKSSRGKSPQRKEFVVEFDL